MKTLVEYLNEDRIRSVKGTVRVDRRVPNGNEFSVHISVDADRNVTFDDMRSVNNIIGLLLDAVKKDDVFRLDIVNHNDIYIGNIKITCKNGTVIFEDYLAGQWDKCIHTKKATFKHTSGDVAHFTMYTVILNQIEHILDKT